MKKNFRNILKKIVPYNIQNLVKKRRIERISKDTQFHFSKEIQLLEDTVKCKKRIILIGTAVSGNLGDQAISIAEMKFLKDNFAEHEIIEIQQTLYLYANKRIKNSINSTDILLINGGGFLGTLWPIAENMARDIIVSFPDNKIVVFPQTIYFEKSDLGEKELKESVRVFQNHNDITLFVRDKKSYDFANSYYRVNNNNNIHLVPDIVTTLKYDEPKLERKNIVFCLRRDKEKINNKELLSNIEIYIKDKYPEYNINYSDTVINEELDMYSREKTINSTMKSFRESKLIITDRLHGLILATISGTPCLALDNVSRKVSGAFEWVSYLPYLSFSNSNFKNEIDRLLSLEETNYSNEKLKQYHNLIKDSINSSENNTV